MLWDLGSGGGGEEPGVCGRWGDWIECEDEENTSSHFWFNEGSGESQWKPPEGWNPAKGLTPQARAILFPEGTGGGQERLRLFAEAAAAVQKSRLEQERDSPELGNPEEPGSEDGAEKLDFVAKPESAAEQEAAPGTPDSPLPDEPAETEGEETPAELSEPKPVVSVRALNSSEPVEFAREPLLPESYQRAPAPGAFLAADPGPSAERGEPFPSRNELFLEPALAEDQLSPLGRKMRLRFGVMGRARLLVLALLALGLLLLGLPRGAFLGLGPALRAFKFWTTGDLALVQTAEPLGALFALPFFSWFALSHQRLPASRVLPWAAALAALCALLAPGALRARGPGFLVILNLIWGGAEGTFLVAALQALGNWSLASETGRGAGLAAGGLLLGLGLGLLSSGALLFSREPPENGVPRGTPPSLSSGFEWFLALPGLLLLPWALGWARLAAAAPAEHWGLSAAELRLFRDRPAGGFLPSPFRGDPEPGAPGLRALWTHRYAFRGADGEPVQLVPEELPERFFSAENLVESEEEPGLEQAGWAPRNEGGGALPARGSASRAERQERRGLLEDYGSGPEYTQNSHSGPVVSADRLESGRAPVGDVRESPEERQARGELERSGFGGAARLRPRRGSFAGDFPGPQLRTVSAFSLLLPGFAFACAGVGLAVLVLGARGFWAAVHGFRTQELLARTALPLLVSAAAAPLFGLLQDRLAEALFARSRPRPLSLAPERAPGPSASGSGLLRESGEGFSTLVPNRDSPISISSSGEARFASQEPGTGPSGPREANPGHGVESGAFGEAVSEKQEHELSTLTDPALEELTKVRLLHLKALGRLRQKLMLPALLGLALSGLLLAFLGNSSSETSALGAASAQLLLLLAALSISALVPNACANLLELSGSRAGFLSASALAEAALPALVLPFLLRALADPESEGARETDWKPVWLCLPVIACPALLLLPALSAKIGVAQPRSVAQPRDYAEERF